jgi:hypothetical protein
LTLSNRANGWPTGTGVTAAWAEATRAKASAAPAAARRINDMDAPDAKNAGM